MKIAVRVVSVSGRVRAILWDCKLIFGFLRVLAAAFLLHFISSDFAGSLAGTLAGYRVTAYLLFPFCRNAGRLPRYRNPSFSFLQEHWPATALPQTSFSLLQAHWRTPALPQTCFFPFAGSVAVA
ncbi:hypothetical protein QA612_17445 [Evansella sp. AB-P1]|uniref:hypothetical protein n=1 Tax=Evansella sp. AB-P1 TaxID=3037653 RepID=UPI00241F96B2|nr:hypothetical protein [Evansella sp. AB-P1]MDG5789247.1 hypothetical protein [Evansella sp. AB-P1]